MGSEMCIRDRLTVGALAAAGALETGYLTASKLVGAGPGLCVDAAACKAVLDGPWSTVGGVPLSAIGFALYAALCAAAFAPLIARGRVADGALAQLEGATTAAIQLGATAAAVFSALLMALLAGEIHAPCLLCICSAAISACIFAVTWNSRLMADRAAAAAYSAASAAATSAFALGAFFVVVSSTAGAGSARASPAGDGDLSYLPPLIEARSSGPALKLAARLKAQHARMFGAYWCSHCYDQKEELGAEAFGELSYVECAKEGARSQADLCRKLQVPGYPTWQIDGRLFPGEKSIDELSQLLDDPVYAREKEYVPTAPAAAAAAARRAGAK